MSRLGLGAVSVGRFNFVCHERLQNALTAGFTLLRESLLLLVQKKRTKEKDTSPQEFLLRKTHFETRPSRSAGRVPPELSQCILR